MTRSQRVLLIAILLLATALRFYRLDGQSLWNDEGNSVRLAQRSLALVTAGAAGDIHPPGYYYLLWAWLRLFGDTEFAARSLSAVVGLLLVAVTYALGRQLDRPALGLTARFLAAISPFQVYYSQEARMYILVTLIGAAATYFFIRLIRQESRRLEERSQPATLSPLHPATYLFYALLTATGLYTHYSYPLVFAVHNVVYGLWLLTTWRKGRVAARSLRWGAVQLGALLLYAPWLPTAWPKLTGYGAISEAHPPAYILAQAFRHYTLGPTAGAAPWTKWLLAGFGALTVLGMARLFTLRRPSFLLRLLLPLYAVAPVALMVALSFSRPAYRPKFFLVGTPAFHLILAHAILLFQPSNPPGTPPRFRPSSLYTAGALLFATLAALPGLHNAYHNPAYARDDYRGIARYVKAAARDGDAILLNAPNQWEVFTYYYGDDPAIYPLPRSRPLDEAATAAELAEIAARHRRIFALYWGADEADPSRFVESWLEGHTYRAVDSWHGGVRLVVYAVPQLAEAGAPQQPLDLSLGDEILLRGYSLAADAVEAGDILQLTLFWEARGRPAERYKVFVQLLDLANHVVGQLDSEPAGNLLPTDAWRPGQAVTDRYGVLVQPGTPPGEHRLIVGMYHLSTGARLPVTKDGQLLGDHLVLGSVSVIRPLAPPPLEALPLQRQAGWTYDGLTLLGYDLHKRGHAHQPDAPIDPGDVLHVNLYWQAVQAVPTDWALNLRLLDDDGQAWAALDAPLAGVAYPPSQWTAGEIVRAQFDLFVPGDAPRGRYRLGVTPLTPANEKGPTWTSPPLPVQ
jgi:4-amino-4-deoxy-L-arabinose transferase-like glycosyltransferase